MTNTILGESMHILRGFSIGEPLAQRITDWTGKTPYKKKQIKNEPGIIRSVTKWEMNWDGRLISKENQFLHITLKLWLCQ